MFGCCAACQKSLSLMIQTVSLPAFILKLAHSLTLSLSPSHLLAHFMLPGHGSAGAHPSIQWVEGRKHPGQAAIPSQGTPTFADTLSPQGNLASPVDLAFSIFGLSTQRKHRHRPSQKLTPDASCCKTSMLPAVSSPCP